MFVKLEFTIKNFCIAQQAKLVLPIICSVLEMIPNASVNISSVKLTVAGDHYFCCRRKRRRVYRKYLDCLARRNPANLLKMSSTVVNILQIPRMRIPF